MRHSLRLQIAMSFVLVVVLTFVFGGLVHHLWRGHPRGIGPLIGITAIVVGAHPLASRLTRRLDGLRRAVEELGAGTLTARVTAQGKDEVGDLGRAFNRAADRIQALVEGQRRVLASASHELRSPLARIRVGLDLMAEEADPVERTRLADAAAADIVELDVLVEGLLLSGRMQVRPPPDTPVDLRVIAEEEAARVGATVEGELVVPGDSVALRHLLRNLLENARRHGAAPIRVVLGPGIVVADAGPGVPPELRERIFEPFYRPAGHREGTDGGVGLGLALVREIARWHGGDVRYEDPSRFVTDVRR